MHDILQNRWGLFFTLSFFVYAYHFVSVIFGMNQYVNWMRFAGCEGASDFKEASAVFDTAIFLVLIFHIIEWVRQTILITTLLVGVPWVVLYNILSINQPFGLIVLIIGMATGFGAHETCITNQPGRAHFLQFQVLTLPLFLMWCQLPIVVFKLGNMIPMLKPTDTNMKGEILYETWVQK